MPIKILMPALSPTMTEGNLAKWIKKEGDVVAAGEVIAEIETDKATMEVEAVDEGILKKIIVPEGSENVAVNSAIAVLLEEGEDEEGLDEFIAEASASEKKSGSEIVDDKQPKQDNSSATSSSTTHEVSNERSGITEKTTPSNTVPTSNTRQNDKIFASPLARRIAAQQGLPLSSIQGSGPRGRIIKRDVLLAASSPRGRLVRNPQEYTHTPNNNMRKVIAKRLLESKLTVPHFYLNIECRMDALFAARAQINNQFGDDKSKRISVNDFIILASAKALKEAPDANSSWKDEAILKYNNVDVAVAVAIDGGLVTPIIRNADQKEITKISQEMKDLAARARAGKLSPEEYQGGGFSISNLGMFGIKSFNAIINPPQSCILAVGQSEKKPVISAEGQMQIATVMEVNLSCDHRVVDGAVGAHFLGAFKKYIESPILMFV